MSEEFIVAMTILLTGTFVLAWFSIWYDKKKRKVVFIPLITTNVRETILIKSGPVNRLEMVAKFQSLLRDFSLIKL